MKKDTGILQLLIVLWCLLPAAAWAQCEVTASVSPGTSVCGDCAELTAFGQGQGQQVFNETFNTGAPSGWAFTQQATYTNPCSAGGVDGTTHIWMGDQSGVPRTLRTVSYNFTTATAGVTVCFDMLFAEQGNAAPCEGPDEPDEGVYLQYSIDNGATWVTVHYFDPNGGNDPDLVNWNNWCFQLPPAAITSNTQIRFFQDADSGADFDHWGIDNVNIYYNDPTYNITWLHDGYSYGVGSSGGVNPNAVCPQATTSYIVEMTNGSFTCRDTITLNVVAPTIEINAGNDTSICPGTCATLDGTAKVVKRPAKTPTYSNNEFQPIANAFGQNTSININVTDLNMTNILPGSITEVCINNLTFFGFSFFPPGQQTIGDLRILLTCPDGTQIILVPNGVTTNTSPLQGYSQTCFVPSGGGNIASGSVPYSGSWAPNQPFNNLVGCMANGLWSMEIVSASPLSFGSGTFFGWSISFDDPEISYPADVVWSPAATLSDPNILNPTACPAATTTYTLTATDTAGCVVVTDDVVVTVLPNCCTLEYTATSTNPDCNVNNGSISINVTQGTGPYTYNWPGGLTGATQNGLAAGTYTITITDNGQANCVKDTTITLVAPLSTPIDSVVVVDENCGLADGSVTIYPVLGAGLYSIDGGATFGPNNVFTGLAAGNYLAVLQHSTGCFDTVAVSIANISGVVIDSITFTPESCPGASDATATVYASGGSLPYNYSWGVSQTNTGLTAGTYPITVTDANGCTAVGSVTIPVPPPCCGLEIAALSADPSCGASDGSITVSVTTGTGPYGYAWTGGLTGPTQTGLAAGVYTITVTDSSSANCFRDTTITLTAPVGTPIDSVVVTDENCGLGDGSISIYPALGAGTYSIDGGNTFSPNNVFTGLGAGNYTAVLQDGSGCLDTAIVTINNISSLVIDSISFVTETCLGDADGSATVYASGGTGALSYLWSNNDATQTATGLTGATYVITVTDNVGCEVVDSAVVPAGPSCCALEFTASATQPSCGNNDGDITITVTQGSGNYTYLWSNNTSNNPATGLAAGSYTVTIIDNGSANCQRDTTISLTNPGAPVIDSLVATAETCPGADDGTVTVYINGGVGSNFVTWSVPSVGNPTSIGPVAAGNYSVTVTDALGCNAVATATVVAAPAWQLSATIANPSCGAANGAIDVTTLGPAPFTYTWAGPSGFVAATEDLTSLAAGVYSLTIEAANVPGCVFDTSFTIVDQGAPVVDSIVATDETCLGDNDGAVAVYVSGGSGNYTYLWSNFSTGQNLSNVAPGNYSVVVTDGLGCTVSANGVVNAGPVCCALTATQSVFDASCGGNDGSILVRVDSSSGIPPYTYGINGGAQGNSANFSNLAVGNYTVLVEDANGCQFTLNATINQANNNVAVSFVATNPTCDGGADGTLEAAGSGGTAPYNYAWSNNATGASLTGLGAGTYTVTVFDANGCSVADDAILINPAPITASLGPGAEICDGQTATLALETGNWSTYAWSTGDSAATLAVDAAGAFSVTVTDANGCTAEAATAVSLAPGFDLYAGEDTTLLFTERLNMLAEVSTGETGVYAWSPNSYLTCTDCADPISQPDSTVTYVVTFTNALGCTDTDTITITVEYEPNIAVVPNAFTPNGDGRNDQLLVLHSANLDEVVLRIYDRWGEMVFETRDPAVGWDGTFKGKEMPVGVFVYTLYAEFKDASSQQSKGSILLLR